MNIESWTLAGIVALTSLLLVLISNIRKLRDEYKGSVKKVVQEEVAPLNAKLDSLSNKIDEVDMNSTKDFLVSRFAEIDRGEVLDEITRQRVYEEMERYQKHGGNSYIHTRFEELKKRGDV